MATVFKMFLKNLLSEPCIRMVYAKLLFIVKLISIKPSFVSESYRQKYYKLKIIVFKAKDIKFTSKNEKQEAVLIS